jgi:hypothetical protein
LLLTIANYDSNIFMVQATDITVVKMSVADAAGNHVGVLP